MSGWSPVSGLPDQAADRHEGGEGDEGVGRVSARVAGGLLVALAAGIGAEAASFEVAFVTDAIGPKALPYLAALILGSSGLRQIFRPGVDVSWPKRGAAVRMVAAIVAFLAYAAALPWIGFFLSTAGVVSILSRLYDGPRLQSVAAAGALAGILWLLFVAILGLPLPVGELWMR